MQALCKLINYNFARERKIGCLSNGVILNGVFDETEYESEIEIVTYLARIYIYVYTTEKQVISRTVITNVTLVFCARQLLVFSVSRSNSIPIIRTGYVSAIYFPHFSFVSGK